MKTIVLDGAVLARRQTALALLDRALPLPPWWGRNLDALCDCLTPPPQPLCLVVYHTTALRATPFGQRLLWVLQDAAAPALRLRLLG